MQNDAQNQYGILTDISSQRRIIGFGFACISCIYQALPNVAIALICPVWNVTAKFVFILATK